MHDPPLVGHTLCMNFFKLCCFPVFGATALPLADASIETPIAAPLALPVAGDEPLIMYPS
jgi:hypothetical protein